MGRFIRAKTIKTTIKFNQITINYMIKLNKLPQIMILLCISTFHADAQPYDYSFWTQESENNNISDKIPKILSDDDVAKYQNAILLQKKQDFKKADTIINTIDDDILIGYIYYHRYVSKNYISSYNELQQWLQQYSSLAVAPIIYDLAKKKSRTYQQSSNLKSPLTFYSRFIPLYLQTNLKLPDDEIKIDLNNSLHVDLINNHYTRRLKHYISKGKTLIVKNILLQPKTKKVLKGQTYDYYSYLLAKSYFLDGHDELAIYWAKIAIKNSILYFPDAIFTIGISYYRLGKYQEAASYFNKMINNDYFSTAKISQGAYWYAKASLANQDFKEYFRGLNIASKYIYDFYGIIASATLGLTPNYSWNYLKVPADSTNILTKNEHGRRAFALLQFGIVDLAELELIFLNNNSKYSFDENEQQVLNNALAYLAQDLPMPALGLKLAGQMGKYYGLSNLAYPVFFTNLKNGYEVNPALLLAVMRRESSFYTAAISQPGARGLMQMMPQTAKYVSKKYDIKLNNILELSTPKMNIEIGQKYAKLLINTANGNLIYTLAAYNAGYKMIDEWSKTPHRIPDDPIFFIESIPYKETRQYVKIVLTDYWIYQYKLLQTPYSLYDIANNRNPIYHYLTPEEINMIIINYKKQHIMQYDKSHG